MYTYALILTEAAYRRSVYLRRPGRQLGQAEVTVTASDRAGTRTKLMQCWHLFLPSVCATATGPEGLPPLPASTVTVSDNGPPAVPASDRDSGSESMTGPTVAQSIHSSHDKKKASVNYGTAVLVKRFEQSSTAELCTCISIH